MIHHLFLGYTTTATDGVSVVFLHLAVLTMRSKEELFDLLLRKELKEKFLRDLNPSERIFFLKKAKESLMVSSLEVILCWK